VRWPRGFTLVELGVVLAVAALLAATLLPDLVEGARVRAAERAALDVSYIHDAARWYYSQTTAYTSGATGLIPDTWPGQSSSGTCLLPPGADPFPLLVQNGFLAYRQQNPWGLPYEAVTVDIPGGGCMFQVNTEVPVEAGGTLESLLPQGRCRNSPGCSPSTIPGYVRCCSSVTRPGVGMATSGCPPPKSLKFNSSGGVTCN